jgi:hypothetical protein
MFRIRRVYDITLSIDKDAVRQVQEILRLQFSALAEKEIQSLPAKLVNPLKYQFRTILFVADNQRHSVKGFALVNFDHDLRSISSPSSRKKMRAVLAGRSINGCAKRQGGSGSAASSWSVCRMMPDCAATRAS